MKKNLKQILSNKILDLAEILPRFRGGTIASLQAIRERQRKWSTKRLEKRQAPIDASVELRQLTLIVTFEFEEFKTIQSGLKRLFPKNEKILNFIKDLKKNENKINSLSWNNIGLIVKEKSRSFPGTEVVVDDLPNDIEYVSLSYHRILPSVAAVVFDFKLVDKVSSRLKSLQDQEYLNPVVFKKLLPFNKLPHSYSMGGGQSGAYEAIVREVSSIKCDLKKWIKNNFKWCNQIMDTTSFVDVYEISGNPTDPEIFKTWKNENRGWLADFGITMEGFGTYINDEIIYCRSKSDDRFVIDADIITKIQNTKESEYGDFLEFKVTAIAVTSSLNSLIEKYRDRLELLRANGFKSLINSNRGILKKASSVQELKRLVAQINRVEHEINQSCDWILHSASEIGLLKEPFKGNEVNLGELLVDNLKYQISSVKESASIIDTGLTNYLSVQSIYVMYKLQKWMFILSVVVTIATIVGVISSWSNLKPIVENIIKIAKLYCK